MQAQDPSFATGAPRFADARLASLAASEGVLATWKQAFSAGRSPAEVLKAVSGRFSVGLRLPDGRCVLAVDRFAVDSVCYRAEAGGLSFAPRADALAGAEPDLDPQAIFDYLYFHVIPAPRTIYRGIQRLPAGHVAVFEQGQLRVEPYWVPTFQEGGRDSFDSLAQEFRGLLREAVASQLDGSKPACFLSGGTDSSTVAGMLGQVANRPAASYSIGFDAEGYDEMEYARLAARHFKTEHHEYYVTPADLVASIPAVAAHYDQPFGNSSALPAFYCAKMAREDGVNHILAGDGGDELFGGNTRYAKQKVFGWYGSIPAVLRQGLLEPISSLGLVRSIPLIKKGASYVNQAKVPMPDRLMTYNLLFHLGLHDVLTPQLLAAVNIEGPAEQQRALWPQAQGKDLVNRMLAFDWRYTLADCDLPKVVGTTGLAGLSVGFPMLDDGLLAFSERLRPDFKLKGLRLRWFFKEALRGFLPDEILTKKKQGFGLPFGVWTARHDGLKALAGKSLHGLADRGIVRREFVGSLLDERLSQHAGYFGEMVWILMMLEQWLAAKAPNYRMA
ncbi:asparagine synthase C-terminal domain-containing protein [Pelomonas sp. SE-A7]|uniref:asparagine synthetase B family protein n=1 Tax=Pelomonas sp. SE-A7 TaxID=3054953 RepID=UPI00259D16CA|nr:asparagine synthase C-terminal domain-containing protein [Pelomonas sp. SE-A7]MDM4764885.1 asparagine synthase C-terminal domain-containing protein [Pelomonas sp. SE-A7]